MWGGGLSLGSGRSFRATSPPQMGGIDLVKSHGRTSAPPQRSGTSDWRSFFPLRIKRMDLSTRRPGRENHRDRPDSGARTGAIRTGFFQSPSGSVQPVSSRAEKLLREAAWGPWEPCISPRLLGRAPGPTPPYHNKQAVPWPSRRPLPACSSPR